MDIVMLFPFVLVCAVSDLRTNRIPNTLILCGLAGALLIRTGLVFKDSYVLSSCLAAAFDGCAGFLLPWLLIGPLAALKMFGGGDVKLLSVIGLWLGGRECLFLMWYSLLIAAAWSVILVIRRRNLVQRLYVLQRYVGQTVTTGKLTAYRIRQKDGGEFCFAVPVLIALVIRMSCY